MKRQTPNQDILNRIKAETTVPLPERLTPERVAEHVAGETVQPKKRHIARYVSVAAAFVLLVLAGLAVWQLADGTPTLTAPLETPNVQTADAGDAYLQTAESYEQIEDLFVALRDENAPVSRFSLSELFNGSDKATASEGFDLGGVAGAVTDGGMGGTSAHGETNVQVEGVDEGDILKNDGSYLYIVRMANDAGYVDIVDIRDPQDLHSVGHIDVCKSTSTEERNTFADITELFVTGETLTVLYTETTYPVTDWTLEIYDGAVGADTTQTTAAVYDITDRAAPVLRYTYAVDGSLISSRMTENTLLLVTEYSVPLYKNDSDLKNASVPCFYKDNVKTRFPVNTVCLTANTESQSYLTVTLLDTASDGTNAQMKAVLGGGTDIYCTDSVLLVAARDHTDAVTYSNMAGDEIASFVPGAVDTRLFAFSLSDGIRYQGSTEIDGTLLNQFAMDAHNGYYRIATTAEDGSCLPVLNESLETVGELRGIAPGEDIYAVRFLGDTAYLVTFYQTDPLFVLDLSDPASPRVTGELKIPGFSNYLHPYAENLLIGIGTAGDENGATGQLKISLFDVGNMQEPKEISAVVFDDRAFSDSAAQYDHHAYLSLSDGTFAIPVTESGPLTDPHSFACVLTVEDGELRVIETYSPDIEGEDIYAIARLTFAGSTLFTLSDTALVAFDRGTGEQLSRIDYPERGALA
mgnify:CR=1 FL=1